jgi:hypothetical protein
VLDEVVFDHPYPWSIRTVARMIHEGNSPENVEELTEIMAGDGTTLGYMVSHQLAEAVVRNYNAQWE